jgi:hypothetical protein
VTIPLFSVNSYANYGKRLQSRMQKAFMRAIETQMNEPKIVSLNRSYSYLELEDKVSTYLASSGKTSSLSGLLANGVFSLVVTSRPESVTSGVRISWEEADEEGRPPDGGEEGRPESTL